MNNQVILFHYIFLHWNFENLLYVEINLLCYKNQEIKTSHIHGLSWTNSGLKQSKANYNVCSDDSDFVSKSHGMCQFFTVAPLAPVHWNALVSSTENQPLNPEWIVNSTCFSRALIWNSQIREISCWYIKPANIYFVIGIYNSCYYKFIANWLGRRTEVNLAE